MIAMVLPVSTRAQTQASDVQEMKNKLQHLEQEMNELKGQISAIEQGPQSPSVTTPAPTSGRAPAAEKPAKAPREDEQKSSIDLYGFIMLDSGYDFKTNDPDWFDVIRPTKLPSFKGEFAPDGKVYFGVRQTRFGVKTSTPTGLGTLKTQFEFELFGTGVDKGQTTFRLRHAYGELGQFGAGQTWSPFMDIDVFPNSLEYWGPNGMVFFRNVQVRWMPIRSDSTRLTFAVERPGASADQGV
jgi:DcaP outer membrane protein